MNFSFYATHNYVKTYELRKINCYMYDKIHIYAHIDYFPMTIRYKHVYKHS